MHFNPRSKSFRKGLLDGFAAHYRLNVGITFERTMKTDASVSAAWYEVGKALSKSDIIERGKLGQETRRAG